MTFEWDERKNAANKEKHHVSFEKAQNAFFDARSKHKDFWSRILAARKETI